MKIVKIDRSITTMGNFEAQYRTKGDFAITVFSGQSGEISLAVSSGRVGKTSPYLKLADADKIKNLLLEAKRAISGTKQPGR